MYSANGTFTINCITKIILSRNYPGIVLSMVFWFEIEGCMNRVSKEAVGAVGNVKFCVIEALPMWGIKFRGPV